MKRADLRDSLISTMRHLLDYKENIELQLAEAKKIILISLEKNEAVSIPKTKTLSNPLFFANSSWFVFLFSVFETRAGMRGGVVGFGLLSAWIDSYVL